MTKLGLVVRLKAKPGKEQAVADFLKNALPAARAEQFTPVWFAFAAPHGVFYIVDAFHDEGGREQHLAGQIAAGLMQHAPELLEEHPHIEKVDVLAEKIHH